MGKDNDNATPAVDPDILKGNEIARAVIGGGIKPEGFRVDFRNGVATLTGSVRSEDERKRVMDAARSVGGVASFTDSLTVGAAAGGGAGAGLGGAPAAGARSYTVKSGDTLSKIAKEHYGDASRYNRIFEANRNILSDPDEIQPGQNLVIPQ